MKGWIMGPQESMYKLEEIGIICPEHWKLSQLPFNNLPLEEWKKCEVTDEQFEKLHELWGKFIWSLE